jgi:glucose-1-phosphate adenylyltransferase
VVLSAGDNSEVRRAIVDKNARIGQNVKIINKDNVMEANRESDGFIIKDGIVVVIKGSIIDSGTVI